MRVTARPRTTAGAALALAMAAAMVHPPTSSAVPVTFDPETSQVTLALDRAVDARLRAQGVRFQVTRPASRQPRRGIAFRVKNGGLETRTRQGSLQSVGNVRVVRGRRRATFVNLTLRFGARTQITANVRAREITLFTLRGGALRRQGGAFRLPRSASWAPTTDGARVLNDVLGVRALRAGRRLGPVTGLLQPFRLPVAQASFGLRLSPAGARALQDAGISFDVQPPATFDGAALQVPLAVAGQPAVNPELAFGDFGLTPFPALRRGSVSRDLGLRATFGDAVSIDALRAGTGARVRLLELKPGFADVQFAGERRSSTSLNRPVGLTAEGAAYLTEIFGAAPPAGTALGSATLSFRFAPPSSGT